MKIRRAAPKDLEQMVELWHGLMDYHYKKSREYYQLNENAEKKWRRWAVKWIRSKDGLVLVAEDKGKLVAHSMNHIKKNVPVYKIARLGNTGDLFVAEGYRNKGIGTKFFQLARGWFKKRKIEYLSIFVGAVNPDARKLYGKWGFRDFHIEMRRETG